MNRGKLSAAIRDHARLTRGTAGCDHDFDTARLLDALAYLVDGCTIEQSFEPPRHWQSNALAMAIEAPPNLSALSAPLREKAMDSSRGDAENAEK